MSLPEPPRPHRPRCPAPPVLQRSLTFSSGTTCVCWQGQNFTAGGRNSCHRERHASASTPERCGIRMEYKLEGPIGEGSAGRGGPRSRGTHLL